MSDSEGRQIDWSNPQRCLVLGVAGFGMRALVEILQQAGHQVFGADHVYGSGTEIIEGAESPPPCVQLVPWGDADPPLEIDVCICSPAIPDAAPLRLWTRQRMIPSISLHTAVAALFAGLSQICVSGTHGKSTTTALLAWILHRSGVSTGVFVGAGFRNRVSSEFATGGGHDGHGGVAVIEACEFDCSFLRLQPQHIILNGIDGDHFDCFDTEDAEDAAYRRFLEKVPADGTVFVNAACSRSTALTAAAHLTAVPWTLHDQSSADWYGRIVDVGAGWMTVRTWYRGQKFSDLRVPFVGRHNAENLLGAVAAASHLGVSAVAIRQAVFTFPGLQRRLEDRGDYNGMQMLDDYAHHPTAVRTTLQTVRQQFAGRRLRVIFEPHQLCRLRRYEGQFIQALSLADDVVLLPVFPAREPVSTATCHRISRDLAATMSSIGTPSVFADGVKTAVSIVETTGQPGDVFVTMGAGTVHRIHDEFHRRFQRNTAP